MKPTIHIRIMEHSENENIFRFYLSKETNIKAYIYEEAPAGPGEKQPDPCLAIIYDLLDESIRITGSKGESLLFADKCQVRLPGDLFLEGDVFARGFYGVKGQRGPLNNFLFAADGEWHTIDLFSSDEKEDEEMMDSDCAAYRITAGYATSSGRQYEFMEAVASHSMTRKFKIRSSNKILGFWTGGLRLRWVKIDRKAFLQIRSSRYIGVSVNISCRVTQVWNYSPFGPIEL